MGPWPTADVGWAIDVLHPLAAARV